MHHNNCETSNRLAAVKQRWPVSAQPKFTAKTTILLAQQTACPISIAQPRFGMFGYCRPAGDAGRCPSDSLPSWPHVAPSPSPAPAQKPDPTLHPRHCVLQDKQADALREKLAMRMEHAPGGPREWRWLAFCLAQVCMAGHLLLDWLQYVPYGGMGVRHVNCLAPKLVRAGFSWVAGITPLFVSTGLRLTLGGSARSNRSRTLRPPHAAVTKSLLDDALAGFFRVAAYLRHAHAPHCHLQLGYSEKSSRRLMELTKAYKHTLAEDQVGPDAPYPLTQPYVGMGRAEMNVYSLSCMHSVLYFSPPQCPLAPTLLNAT